MPDFQPELHAFNEIHSPVLFLFVCLLVVFFFWGGGGGGGECFESIKGSGHTHKYSTSFTHSFQPQAKLPVFQPEGQ